MPSNTSICSNLLLDTIVKTKRGNCGYTMQELQYYCRQILNLARAGLLQSLAHTCRAEITIAWYMHDIIDTVISYVHHLILSKIVYSSQTFAVPASVEQI